MQILLAYVQTIYAQAGALLGENSVFSFKNNGYVVSQSWLD